MQLRPFIGKQHVMWTTFFINKSFREKFSDISLTIDNFPLKHFQFLNESIETIGHK